MVPVRMLATPSLSVVVIAVAPLASRQATAAFRFELRACIYADALQGTLGGENPKC
jgi:hypothetical protein